MLDRENGLFVWAPVYIPVFAALWTARRVVWPLLVPVLLLFVPSAAHDLWWGGFSPVGRFLVPLTPFLVFALAETVYRPEASRLFYLLCIPQGIISAVSWQHPRVLWPIGDGHNRMLERLPVIGARLADALPSFRSEFVSPRLAITWFFVVGGVNVLLLFMLRHRQSVTRPA